MNDRIEIALHSQEEIENNLAPTLEEDGDMTNVDGFAIPSVSGFAIP